MTAKRNVIEDMFETVSLGAPDKAVGFMLWRVVHRYQRTIDKTLAPLDLTHLQFTTLAMAAWLTRNVHTTTQSAIAQAAEIHPMQVSHMLKTLESKGLVLRARDNSDGRFLSVSLTDTGVEKLRAAMPLAIDVQRVMFGEDNALLGFLRQIEPNEFI